MLISTDQYRAQCEQFFMTAEHTAEAIARQVESLTAVEFQVWQSAIIERYDDATKGLIRSLVAEINFDEEVESKTTTAQRHVVRTYLDINNNVCQVRIFDLVCVQAKSEELRQWYAQEEQKRLMGVQVDGRAFVAEEVVDVLWSGWECDNHAWLVRDEGVARLVTTDHGSAQFSDRAFLEERIASYQEAIAKTQRMLALLDQ